MVDENLTDDEEFDDDEEDDEEEKERESPRPSKRHRHSQNRHQSSGSSRSGSQFGYSRGVNFRSRRKVCAFCADKTKTIDWKEVETLRRFVADNGSIRARRKTGTCAKHQRRLAIAIKRARQISLLPFTSEHIRLANK